MNRRDFMKAATAASWCDLDFVRTAIEMAEHNPAIGQYLDYMSTGLAKFQPRPDDPDAPGCPDEQTSFCDSKDRVAFLIGGNGAGTSVAAAYKAAKFLLKEQSPPRRNTPFWVMSNTFENTCNVCWGEKLHGMGFIPECEVDRVVYHNAARNQPKAVILKEWPGQTGKNWVLEFKTFEQGRSALQGASLGGFWISETPPASLVAETVRGLRDYNFVGACLIEFTPLDPWLSLEMEQVIERAPNTWGVYKANTVSNLPNLPGGQEWIDNMLAFTPEELHATRLYGDFAVFENQIYPSFRQDTHMVDEAEIEDHIRNNISLVHAMGTDWGWTTEHAHCTLWGAWEPSTGAWIIYDEYWTNSQTKIIDDHIIETIERCEYWGWPTEKGYRGRTAIASGRHQRFTVNHADCAAPGNIRQYNTYGVPTIGYSKTENAEREGIFYIRNLLRPPGQGPPLLVISSRCKHLLNEIHMCRWKRGQSNMTALNPAIAKPIPLDRYMDSPDALRYMVMGERVYEGLAPTKNQQRALEHAERQASQAHININRRSWSNGGGARGLVRFNR